jgi:hypothetical protein
VSIRSKKTPKKHSDRFKSALERNTAATLIILTLKR